MSKEFSLISTKLELEVCKNKKKVLAGNWCYQDNDKKKFHSNLVTNNPWSSPRDFNNDYKYIKDLLNRCIISIVEYLNKIHNKKFSKKFWKILILPWLTIYLPAYYFRWRLIKQILKIQKDINFYNLENLKNEFVPTDSYDFHKNIRNSQEFNYLIFRKIIFFLNTKEKVKVKKNYIKINCLIITKQKIINSCFNLN